MVPNEQVERPCSVHECVLELLHGTVQAMPLRVTQQTIILAYYLRHGAARLSLASSSRPPAYRSLHVPVELVNAEHVPPLALRRRRRERVQLHVPAPPDVRTTHLLLEVPRHQMTGIAGHRAVVWLVRVHHVDGHRATGDEQQQQQFHHWWRIHDWRAELVGKQLYMAATP